ncbi:hypothetical protein ANN_13373 [Periplaneta americana]|uniref:Uncharacterized protein n=1 Tax=Periplaneta americana TaxID=6978 RepID=A0ABQ8TKN3_PERAM|nr:hypothetical protein ANN_13373 [Periplaneta americana]
MIPGSSTDSYAGKNHDQIISCLRLNFNSSKDKSYKTYLSSTFNGNDDIRNFDSAYFKIRQTIDRHNKIRSMIANELRRTDKYEVYEEIGCLSADGSTRRADIIIIDRKKLCTHSRSHSPF